MFSTRGTHDSLLPDISGWPFLKIVIGLPTCPIEDQLFFKPPSVLAVLPNLILLPNLLSNILSPAKGTVGFTFPFSTNCPPLVPFKSSSNASLLSLLVAPASILW